MERALRIALEKSGFNLIEEHPGGILAGLMPVSGMGHLSAVSYPINKERVGLELYREIAFPIAMFDHYKAKATRLEISGPALIKMGLTETSPFQFYVMAELDIWGNDPPEIQLHDQIFKVTERARNNWANLIALA